MNPQGNRHDGGAADEKETGRLEAFSDGVFAIAITLLVLNIKVPDGQKSLVESISGQLPQLAGFVVSFLTILVLWVNHHAMFQAIHHIDRFFLMLNGVLLLLITFVNYPTAVVAEYLGTPDAALAAVLYNGTFVLIAVFYNAMWFYAAHNRKLIGARVSQQNVDAITQQYRFGPLFYLIALLLAFVSVWLSLAVDVALALYFTFTGRRR